MKKNPVFLVAAIVLFIALADLQIGYYQLLRFFICGVGAYGAFKAYEDKRIAWAWILGFIAVLFNPFIKIYFKKEMWKIADFIAAIAFIGYFVQFKSKKS